MESNRSLTADELVAMAPAVERVNKYANVSFMIMLLIIVILIIYFAKKFVMKPTAEGACGNKYAF